MPASRNNSSNQQVSWLAIVTLIAALVVPLIAGLSAFLLSGGYSWSTFGVRSTIALTAAFLTMFFCSFLLVIPLNLRFQALNMDAVAPLEPLERELVEALGSVGNAKAPLKQDSELSAESADVEAQALESTSSNSLLLQEEDEASKR